jgi:hypothetical protein
MGGNMSIPKAIGIEIHNITFKNRRLKFYRAMGKLADALELPIGINKAILHKEHSQEPYLYNIQQELSDRWVRFFDNMIRNI